MGLNAVGGIKEPAVRMGIDHVGLNEAVCGCQGEDVRGEHLVSWLVQGGLSEGVALSRPVWLALEDHTLGSGVLWAGGLAATDGNLGCWFFSQHCKTQCQTNNKSMV